MNHEFNGNVIQKVGFINAKGVNSIKAGLDNVFSKDNFRHSYQFRMMGEVRNPNMLAAKGWATIIAIEMISTLLVNSLK